MDTPSSRSVADACKERSAGFVAAVQSAYSIILDLRVFVVSNIRLTLYAARHGYPRRTGG